MLGNIQMNIKPISFALECIEFEHTVINGKETEMFWILEAWDSKLRCTTIESYVTNRLQLSDASRIVKQNLIHGSKFTAWSEPIQAHNFEPWPIDPK